MVREDTTLLSDVPYSYPEPKRKRGSALGPGVFRSLRSRLILQVFQYVEERIFVPDSALAPPDVLDKVLAYIFVSDPAPTELASQVPPLRFDPLGMGAFG